jgi:hypothetical protein
MFNITGLNQKKVDYCLGAFSFIAQCVLLYYLLGTEIIVHVIYLWALLFLLSVFVPRIVGKKILLHKSWYFCAVASLGLIACMFAISLASRFL